MRVTKGAAAVLAFGVAGCTTVYKPAVYELTPDRIPAFEAVGVIRYVNAQPAGTKRKSGITLRKYEYDLTEITDAFNRQLAAEVDRRRKDGAAKTLTSKVTKLHCEEPTSLVPTFTLTCDIELQVKTGEGDVIPIIGHQTAPLIARAGRHGVERSLDGTIAIGVIQTLSDARVRAYLSK